MPSPTACQAGSRRTATNRLMMNWLHPSIFSRLICVSFILEAANVHAQLEANRVAAIPDWKFQLIRTIELVYWLPKGSSLPKNLNQNYCKTFPSKSLPSSKKSVQNAYQFKARTSLIRIKLPFCIILFAYARPFKWTFYLPALAANKKVMQMTPTPFGAHYDLPDDMLTKCGQCSTLDYREISVEWLTTLVVREKFVKLFSLKTFHRRMLETGGFL